MQVKKVRSTACVDFQSLYGIEVYGIVTHIYRKRLKICEQIILRNVALQCGMLKIKDASRRLVISRGLQGKDLSSLK
jgi:hypothetical protein